MKKRVELLHSKKPENLLAEWQREADVNGEAKHYGRVLALIELERWDEADAQLATLLADNPQRIAYIIARAEIQQGQEKGEAAIATLKQALSLSPRNHSLTMTLAAILQENKLFRQADQLLTVHSEQRSEDPHLWYELAEVRGLAGNILGVHMARAEYFILVAQFERASKQLRYAHQLIGSDNRVLESKIRQRLRDIDAMKDEMKELQGG